MDDLTLTTRLVGDASSLNAALAQGEKGVKTFGDEAAAAAKKQSEAGRTTAAGLDAQQQAMRRARVEANMLAQANRMLPMQLTDVVTSLASGMPVWMVAIQQGGQLRDSYGGLAPMGKAIADMFTVQRVAALGGAAAVGVLVAAYYSGRAEADAYARAIAMSGNAAGGTIDQYNTAAEAIGRVVGTQAQAAEVIAALAGTGRVAAGAMDQVGEAVLRMGRDLGIATDEAVGMFAALGKDPVQASAKLNEQYRYLTVSVYEQIKALKEQGRESEAAALAQQTFAAANIGRAKEMEERLGYVQRAARAVTDTAKEMWSALLGVGRADTITQKINDQMQRVAQMRTFRGSNDPQVQEAEQQLRYLQELRRFQEQGARVQAAQTAETERHIKTEKDREKALKASADAYRSLADGIAQDIALLQAQVAAGGALSDARRQELRTLQEIAQQQGVIGAQRAAELQAEAARRAQLADVLALEQQVAAGRAQVAQAAAQALRQSQQLLDSETAQLEERNRSLQDEVVTMGLSTRALLAVEQARVSSALAIKEEQLAKLEAEGAYSTENENLARQIGLLRERLQLLGQKSERAGQIEAEAEAERRRRDEEQEAQRRRQSFADSITQGIVDGYRNGRSLSEIFLRELKAQFAKTVLSPVIRPLADAGSNLLETIIGGIAGLFTGGAGGNSIIPGGAELPGELRGGKAGGGRMEPYGDYWVGENGPERVRMGGRGAYVFPAHATGDDRRSRGRQVVQNNTINIGERVDRAEVYSIALQAVRLGNAELLDMMARGEV